MAQFHVKRVRTNITREPTFCARIFEYVARFHIAIFFVVPLHTFHVRRERLFKRFRVPPYHISIYIDFSLIQCFLAPTDRRKRDGQEERIT